MTDDRPRPEYGEYATPEQQAAAMGKRPIPPLRHQPELPPRAPAPYEPSQFGMPPRPNAEDRIEDRHLPRNHPVDRVITFALLGIGLFSLLNSLPAYFNFGRQLSAFAEALGFSYTPPASAASAGYGIFAAHVVLFVITLIIAVRTVRRGRLAFYVPLIGYALFEIATVTILVSSVPGFFALIQDHIGALQ